MKALFYSHTGKVSGAENVLLLLLERLDRSRIEPVAVCPSEGGLSDEIESLGIPVSNHPEVNAKFRLTPASLSRSLASVAAAVGKLKAKIETESPDVIHANSVRAGVVATLASIGSDIPVAWHIQDDLGTHPISTAIRLLVKLSKRTSLIPVSAATLKSFCGRLLSAKSIDGRAAVVLNGVQSSRFDVLDTVGEELRASLGMTREDIVFGCIGQITPRKNQKGLVEAFAAIADEVPCAKLAIIGSAIFAGDDRYLDEVKQLVSARDLEDRVYFLGQRRDVPEVLSAMDVVVINSHSEALVLVAIEAMMAGRPVIATRVGGTEELIEHLVSGWLIPPGDNASLEEALVRMAGNPAMRISLAKEGRLVARKRFTAERMAADFERFIIGRATRVERNTKLVVVEEAVAEGR